MTNAPFRKGTGRLALDRFDFQQHIEGLGFRHDATQIDIANPSLIFGNPSTVESALESVNSYINSQINAGQGFVTVGDGYDTWHAANGSVNFDPSIPTLDTLLNPIFLAIYNGQVLPGAYQRIAASGVLVLKAGTYVVANTISVPPGITILGEGYGTKIVNITSLNIPASGIAPTPKGSPTPAPLFRILPDLDRAIQDAPVDGSLFMFARPTKIMNMIISDNFIEPTIAGENFYKLPQNTSGSNPLIQQAAGSSLELFGVYLMGRVLFSVGKAVSSATRFAIQLDDSTLPISNGTHLKIGSCFIDGFSQPVQYFSGGGINDYLGLNNSKIRSHGYLDGDGTSASKNCIVSCNDNNTIIENNDLFGNHSNCKTIMFLNGQLVSAPPAHSVSKAIIAGNTWVIDRGGTGSITPTAASINASIAATYTTRIAIIAHSNVFDSFVIDTPQLQLNSSAFTFKTPVFYPKITVNSNYTVDSSGFDYYIYISSATVSPFTITLPQASANDGRTIVIKDQGIASTNNITLARSAAGVSGGEQIEGLASSYIIDASFQTIHLTSQGGNWWFTN